MSELPGDLLYTKEHEWLRREDDGSVSVGITDHAQSSLGDLVYVELPEVGQDVEEGGDMAVVESVKAASDVFMPLSGTITEINEAIVEEPGKVNEDAMGEGWFFKFRLADISDADGLLDEAGYLELVS